MLDPELTNLTIGKNTDDELLNLRPARVLVVLLLRIKVNPSRERNLVLGATITEPDTQTAGKGGHIVDTIVERNEIDIVIRLHAEGFIKEEFAALLHHIILELGATEISAYGLKQLLLRQHLAERASQLGLLMLALRHLLDSLAEHILDVIALDLPDLSRELALQMNATIRLLPHVACEAEPHIVRKLGTLVIIAEVSVNHTSHIVLRTGTGSLDQINDVILADLLVSLGVIGLGPEEKRSHSQSLTILTERESVPLLNAVTLVELVRATRGEVQEGIQKIHMNVLQTLSDFLPILVVHRTLLAEIVDMGLDEAPLFLIQWTLAGLGTWRRTASSARLTASRRTTASGGHRTTSRDSLIGLLNLIVHLGCRFRHRRSLFGVCTNRELLDELDGDRGFLRVHRDFAAGLRTNPCDLVRKTACLLGFLEHPLLSVSENRLVLDVLPINDEGETAEEFTHSRNQSTTNGLLNETCGTDIGDHNMNARLAAMLFAINRGTSLFHDVDLGICGNREKLLRLFHLRLQKAHNLLLSMLVLDNVLGLNEVEIHAKLANWGRLFREMQWTLIVFDVLHIQLLELIHGIFGNEEGPRRSSEGGVRKHTTLLNATVFEELGEAHLCYHPTIS